MTDREAELLKALIEITEYYQRYRREHKDVSSAAVKRALAVIRKVNREAFHVPSCL